MILVLTGIKPSPIHGLGLFAVEMIRKGTVVWEYNVNLQIPFDNKRLW
jgi:hypothetical protein